MRECGTGGGAVIKGEKDRRSPHPSPSCKPAGGRRGGEYPGRRSLEGVGGVLGSMGKKNFWLLFLFSYKKSVFIHLGAREWLGLPGPVFG